MRSLWVYTPEQSWQCVDLPSGLVDEGLFYIANNTANAERLAKQAFRAYHKDKHLAGVQYAERVLQEYKTFRGHVPQIGYRDDWRASRVIQTGFMPVF